MSGQKFPARASLMLGFGMLAVLVGGFGVWSFGTTLSGAVIAPGQIEVEQNRQIVQHIDGGVVAEIKVAEGSRVSAGEVLMRLDGTLLRSELAIVESQLYESLARRGRLEAERDDTEQPEFRADLVAAAAASPDVAELMEGQKRLFDARRTTIARQTEQLARRAEQTESQIEGIDAQTEALQSQLALIRQELVTVQDLLDKGLAESSRVLSLQREEARLMGQVGELIAGRASSEGRITEIELEVLRLAAARREEASTQLRDVGVQELQLVERRRALIERIARLDIVAPVSGIVLGLQVTTPRAVLRPADPVCFVIPQDRPLVIAARVQPINIDEVRAGQAVVLTFSAFSTRTTPQVNGTITTVSADALVDERSQGNYYRAEIMLNEGEMNRLGSVTLVPGMPVEAFIQTEPRTPMAYFVKPFTDYFNRAFREG